MRPRFERPLTSVEAAEYLRIGMPKLYELVREGTLPYRKVLQNLYFSRRTLDRFLGITRTDDTCPVVVCTAMLHRDRDGRRVEATFDATARLWLLTLPMIRTLRRNPSLRVSLWEGAAGHMVDGLTCDDVRVGTGLPDYVAWRKRHDDDYEQVHEAQMSRWQRRKGALQ